MIKEKLNNCAYVTASLLRVAKGKRTALTTTNNTIGHYTRRVYSGCVKAGGIAQ